MAPLHLVGCGSLPEIQSIRTAADNGEIFIQLQALDTGIDDKSLTHQAQQGPIIQIQIDKFQFQSSYISNHPFFTMSSQKCDNFYYPIRIRQ